MNLNEILVAVDFSDCSINALEHAITIAQRADSDLHMLYVLKPEQAKSSVSVNGAETPAEVEEKFKEMIKKFQIRLKNSKITYSIKTGRVYKEIVSVAEERDCYLIVAGTHGKSGFEEFWMGSNAFRLVSAATRPIITIRSGIKVTRSMRNIVVPIDSTLETRQKIPFTALLAKLFGAKIIILLIYSTQVKAVRSKVQGYGDQVAKYLQKNEIKYVIDSVETDNLTNATIDYALKVDANLISIMTEQEKTAANLWLGPYASQMVNHSPIPVLSIQPQEIIRTTY
jgi:nucleotide-binding universal stress UspA family protein